MPSKHTVDRAQLKELLHYNPATGEFTRRVGRKGHAAGTRAGTTNKDGYVAIMIDGVSYLAHRLAWFYTHGVWPPAEVDHINGIPSDNRIVNLRLATRSENAQNRRRARRDNKLGVLGVCQFRSKFMAFITISGVQRYLGLFLTKEEAHRAYLTAKAELHPFDTTANAS